MFGNQGGTQLTEFCNLIQSAIDKKLCVLKCCKGRVFFAVISIKDYTIIERIGSGGMAIVYLAKHNKLGYKVAIKVLSDVLTSEKSVRKRFYLEAKVMASLRHPGIVSVSDFIETDNNLAIVMEYINGPTLSSVIGKETGPIPEEKALPLFKQILSATGHAHDNGVIHRDLKPSNIILENSKTVKVMDFGIAKLADGSSATRTGTKLGTLHYMSPEQIRGSKNVDVRSDIYSLGMTLYEMLAGRLPFEDSANTSDFDISQKIVFEEFEPPSVYYPHIPQWLVSVVKKAIDKDPDQRYQNCEEFMQAIESGVVKKNVIENKSEVPVSSHSTYHREIPKSSKFSFTTVAAVITILALIVVFVVIKPFSGADEPDVDPAEVVEVFQPYSVSYTVGGVENYSVTVDGEAVTVLPDGSFLIEGDSEASRALEVSSYGFDTYCADIVFQSGEDGTRFVSLYPIGTSTVQVVMQAVGGGDGEISWFVDGQEVESATELSTGIHIFQAVQEGSSSIPESLYVGNSADVLQISLALYSQGESQASQELLSQEESQISLALAGDIPGSGIFTIDGVRINSGVRRISEVLPFGEHTLRVDVEGHETWSRTITLTSTGYSATVSPVADVTTGRLVIAPEPWSNVSIDGVTVGQTPMPPIELEEGSHTVVLTNPDYEDQTSSVFITVGEDASVRYTASEIQDDQPEEIAEDQPVIAPFPISQVGPQVPSLASEIGNVHGYVTMDVLVGTGGTVRSVSIVNDELGLGCGAAAEAAVRQWIFNPATQGGVPVEVSTTVSVRFDIE